MSVWLRAYANLFKYLPTVKFILESINREPQLWTSNLFVGYKKILKCNCQTLWYVSWTTVTKLFLVWPDSLTPGAEAESVPISLLSKIDQKGELELKQPTLRTVKGSCSYHICPWILWPDIDHRPCCLVWFSCLSAELHNEKYISF